MLAFATVADWVILGALVVMILMLASLKAAVTRLELRVSKIQKTPVNKARHDSGGDDSDGHESAFEQFLAEDPARLGMSKSEQFAAYRQWRKDKGMNWSA